MSDSTGYLTAEPLKLAIAYNSTFNLAMILLLFEWWYYAKELHLIIIGL